MPRLKSWLAIPVLLMGLAPGWALRLEPDEYLPVTQVKTGMTGIGYSVFRGTEIEPFGVEVLGVLENSDFDQDMILVRVTSGPVVERDYGIIQGMSGSPIFIGGKIVGALAYAFAFSKAPIAGITPIEQMARAFSPQDVPPERSRGGSWRLRERALTVDGRRFDRFQVGGDNPGGEPAGTLVLQPMLTPIMVSGLGPRGLRFLEHLLRPYHLQPVQGPGGGQISGVPRGPLQPGAAIGTQLARGDIDVTMIGTLTYRKGNEILAYGHPMFQLGDVALPMTSAYIHAVLPSLEASFKMGVPLDPIGVFTQDRLAGAGGILGPAPDMLPAEFEIVDRDRGVSKTYHVEIARQKEVLNGLLYSLLAGALSAATSDAEPGALKVRLRVEPEGFQPIERQNTFSGSGGGFSSLGALLGGGGGGPLLEMMEVVETLTENRFRRVPIHQVAISVEVSQKKRFATLERAYADRERVRPGEEVRLTVEFRPYEQEPVTRRFTVRIPQDAPPGRILIGLSGGETTEILQRRLGIRQPEPETLPQLLRQLGTRWANDRLVITAGLPTVGLELKGERIPDLPLSVSNILRAAADGRARPVRDGIEWEYPLDWVIQGLSVVPLTIESKEPDKVRPPSPADRAGEPPTNIPGSLVTLSEEEESAGPLRALRPEECALLRWKQWLAHTLGVQRWPAALPAWEAGGMPARLAEGLDQELASTASSGGSQESGDVAPPQPDQPPPPEVTAELKPEEAPGMPTWEEVEKVGFEAKAGPVTGAPPKENGRRRSKGVARAPKSWVHLTLKDFSEGELEGTYLTTKGEIVLAPAVQPLAEMDKGRPWSLVVGPDGNLYAGSWIDARVLRITPDGQISPLFEASGVGISALAFDTEGRLYAAVVPDGRIVRLSEQGQAEEWSDLEASYVWALAPDGRGGFFAATGPEGKVFHLDADGRPTLRFQCGDRHAFALVVAPDGAAYVGTYPKGKIYHLPAEGEVETLFEVPKAPVHCLALDGAGNLFVGTAPEGTIYRITPTGAVTEFYKPAAKQVLSLVTDGEGNVYAGAAEPGAIYRVRPDGSAALLYSSDNKERYILRLAADGNGQLYAATAGPSRVLRLNMRGSDGGTYTSPVLDAKEIAGWGRMTWEVRGGGSVSLQTRSGNTAHPGVGWSDWSPEMVAATGATIASPPGRYLQYRARFFAGDGEDVPRLTQVRLVYLTRNLPPQVELKTPKPGEVLTGKVTLSWTAKDPDDDKLTYELYYSTDGGQQWTRLEEKKPAASATQQEKEQGEAPPPQKSSPAQEGPVEQPTTGGSKAPASQATAGPTWRPVLSRPFGLRWLLLQEGVNVEPQEEGDAAQREKAQEGADEQTPEPKPEEAAAPSAALTKTTFSWDTEQVPDGRYWVKVVASDQSSNPLDPETKEVVSESFVIDNTAPLVLAPLATETVPASVRCYDATTYVASAEYRLDQGEWVAATCADRIFDSPYEDVVLRFETPVTGSHTLEIRVRDAIGNEASRVVQVGKKE